MTVNKGGVQRSNVTCTMASLLDEEQRMVSQEKMRPQPSGKGNTTLFKRPRSWR